MQKVNHALQDNTGLQAFVMLARFHQTPAEPEQLRRQFTPHGEAFDTEAMRHAAKAIGLKCRVVNKSVSQLEKVPLPAIAKDNEGRFFIIAKVQASPSSKTEAPPEQPIEQSILIQ